MSYVLVAQALDFRADFICNNDFCENQSLILSDNP